MRRAIITVGLGFGDEGKGATVDYLTRTLEADLVVRYCGGSQAGHNVQLPDGRRHTFSQFGAGTLVDLKSPVRTYLGPAMIIDPLAMIHEANHLRELGVSDPLAAMIIHPHSLVTTIWHRTLNQIREVARGTHRHGSCGQGIGETRHYWLQHGEDAVMAADLRRPDVLRRKLELLRQRMLLQVQEILERVPAEDFQDLDLWGLNTEEVMEELLAAFAPEIGLSSTVPPCHTAVFEGAQGVLLDEYRGFHPHTTWSTVTTHHAWELVQQMNVDAVSVLGITRAYTTRHGAGPLPTHNVHLTERLRDPGNPTNAWQGSLRCGWLDLPLLRYAIDATGPLDGLVVNHLDHVSDEWWICEEYEGSAPTISSGPNLQHQSRLNEMVKAACPVLKHTTTEDMLDRLSEMAAIVILGSGPTHLDRSEKNIRFRLKKKRTEAVDLEIAGIS